MKVPKLITLDSDIHERLSKITNASAFVNDMLRKKFDVESLGQCDHEYSEPYSAAGGLVKQCKLCGELKKVGIK